MSIWKKLRDALASVGAGRPLSALFLREPERTVAFTIAVIALGAKMAKADGRVTRNEIAAFRDIFYIRPEDEAAAARVFNTARADIAGYEFYARRVARMFRDRPGALLDLLEGLVHIAMADGEYHPHEAEFLDRIARIFGISETDFRSIRARHVPSEEDPYAIVGVSPGESDAAIKAAYRMRVRELHPDRMLARGVPEEARRLAEDRLARVTAAYDAIRRERAEAAG